MQAHSDYFCRQLSVRTVPHSYHLNGLLQKESIKASELAFHTDHFHYSNRKLCILFIFTDCGFGPDLGRVSAGPCLEL